MDSRIVQLKNLGFTVFEFTRGISFLRKPLAAAIKVGYKPVFFSRDSVAYSGLFPLLLYRDKNRDIATREPREIVDDRFTQELFDEVLEVCSYYQSEHRKPKAGEFPAVNDTIAKFVADIPSFRKNSRGVFYRKIQGIAGTGKTIDIAFIAANYASIYPERSVLIVTYNITLRNKIRHYLKLAPFNYSVSQVTVAHYHAVFKPRKREGGGPWDFDYRASDIKPEYDLILVDETQDHGMDRLRNLVDLARHCIVFFGDMEQDIYGKNPGEELTEGKLRAPSAPGSGTWKTLKTPYRCSGPIFELSQLFRKAVIERKDIPIVDPGKFYSVSYRFFDSEDDLEAFFGSFGVLETFENFDFNRAILFTGNRDRIIRYCSGVFSRIFFGKITKTVADRIEDRYWDRSFKVAFDTFAPFVKVSTVKSFKGLEQRTVFLVIFPRDTWQDQIEYLNEVYVGLTRATEELIILNLNRDLHGFFSALIQENKTINLL